MAIWGAPSTVFEQELLACASSVQFASAMELLSKGLPSNIQNVTGHFFNYLIFTSYDAEWVFILDLF